jgi:hypothetical protein
MEPKKIKCCSNLDAKPPRYRALGPKEKAVPNQGEQLTPMQLKEIKNYKRIPKG